VTWFDTNDHLPRFPQSSTAAPSKASPGGP
jgi:hypothetical protein